MHETLWIPHNLGTTATPCWGAPAARPERAPGSPPGAGVGELAISVVAGLGTRRRCRLSPQTRAWASRHVDSPTTTTVDRAVAARRQGLRLPQRAGDLEAHRGGNPSRVRGPLSPRAHLEGLAGRRLELSGAGGPRHPARRAGDRPGEALQVAGDKTKPAGWERSSPSSTKAASCSSPRAAGAGLPGDRPPSSPISISLIGSRRWPLSRCRRSASTWAWIAVSSRPLSKPPLWRTSCERCCVSGGAMASSCGLRARSPKGQPLPRSSRPILGCLWKSSRPLLRSSTLQSTCGTTLQAIPPIVCGRSCASAAADGRPIPVGSGAPRQSCARVSWHPSSRRRRDDILMAYAKFNRGSIIRAVGTTMPSPSHKLGG